MRESHAKRVWQAWLDGKPVQYWHYFEKAWKNGAPNELPKDIQPQNKPKKWRIKPDDAEAKGE